jgi:hypothetical protein
MTQNTPRVLPQEPGRFGPGTVFALAAAIALAFALFTDQRWEDYYITFRVSQNLARGVGLVFQPGERVHAFTSPLGVLLPALISWSTGTQSDELTLWIFRLVTIGAFAGAAATVWSIARALGWSRLSCAFAAGLAMTDAKSVSFSTNGMETAFMLLFLALSIRRLVAEPKGVDWGLACCWAALMWTRPDSFIFFGGVALGWWLFAPGSRLSGARAAMARRFLKASLVCAALYLPWFVWAWWYFGSPIPHTVVAKAFGNNLPNWPGMLLLLVTLPIRCWAASKWDFILLPTYAGDFGGWPPFITYVVRALGGIVVWAFMLPRMAAATRALSVAFIVAIFYLAFIQLFPWYMPPAALLAILVLAGVLEAGLKAFRRKAIPIALGAAVVLFSASLLAASAWQLRQQQRIIEGQRKEIGMWLKANSASPADTVFLEPLGYIGYYSGLKMLDYPGLSSTEVVAARRKVGENRLALVGELKPRWVVQRPGELYSADAALNAWFLEHYAPTKIFNASDQIAAIPFLPGRRYLQFDQGFLIWKRKD